MDRNRCSEWIDNSHSLMHVEMLLVGNAQGLGLLDVELIQEFPKLKISSQLKKDRLRKLKYITLSELWVMGAYELLRLMGFIIPKHKDIFSEDTRKELKEVISIFTEVRIPLVKFQERGKDRLYSGVAQPEFDSIKGVGWKIHFSRKAKIETEIFYRKDLGDSLLKLLKKLKEDIHAKSYDAWN